MDNVFKRASWLELFYDVAFVALIAQLTYLAAANHQALTDYLHIFIVGYSVFVAWWATTANRNLQPTETTADKLFTQLTMVAVFVMSLTMPVRWVFFDPGWSESFASIFDCSDVLSSSPNPTRNVQPLARGLHSGWSVGHLSPDF